MELQIDVDWATGSNVPREMLSRPEAQRRLNVRTSGASVDDGLKIGSIHSWADLKQRFAWDTDKHGYFLPEKNGRIVCACLRADLNPSAPWEILVGTEAAHIRKAEMLIREMSPIPVFIKLAVDQWEYWGEFRFDRCDSNLEQITGMLPQHRLSDTSMVLFLKEAT